MSRRPVFLSVPASFPFADPIQIVVRQPVHGHPVDVLGVDAGGALLRPDREHVDLGRRRQRFREDLRRYFGAADDMRRVSACDNDFHAIRFIPFMRCISIPTSRTAGNSSKKPPRMNPINNQKFTKE